MARRIVTVREQFDLTPWRSAAHHPHAIQDALHHYFEEMPYDLEVEDSHDWDQHHPEDPDEYKYKPLDV